VNGALAGARHCRLEQTVGPAAIGLGAVHREIRVLQEMIEVGAWSGASAMPMLASAVSW